MIFQQNPIPLLIAQDLNSFATELKQKIELFRAEEIEHKNIAIQNGGSENNR